MFVTKLLSTHSLLLETTRYTRMVFKLHVKMVVVHCHLAPSQPCSGHLDNHLAEEEGQGCGLPI
jgi:hypothetical protein